LRSRCSSMVSDERGRLMYGINKSEYKNDDGGEEQGVDLIDNRVKGLLDIRPPVFWQMILSSHSTRTNCFCYMQFGHCTNAVSTHSPSVGPPPTAPPTAIGHLQRTGLLSELWASGDDGSETPSGDDGPEPTRPEMTVARAPRTPARGTVFRLYPLASSLGPLYIERVECSFSEVVSIN